MSILGVMRLFSFHHVAETSKFLWENHVMAFKGVSQFPQTSLALFIIICPFWILMFWIFQRRILKKDFPMAISWGGSPSTSKKMSTLNEPDYERL